METYHIKTETADAIRAAAGKFNMVASTFRETVAPGIEAMHLTPFHAVAFNEFKKRRKIGVDAAILRLVK